MAGAQPDPALGVLLVQKEADDLRPERKPHALAHLMADPDVLLLPQVVDLDLVPDPSQERLVGQFPRRDVRGEEDDLVERDLELLPVLESQVVARLFQGDDPPVEQVEGADQLPPEIVDEEDPPVGLQLERRLVELGDRVEAQVQHRQRQLPPGDDHRAIAQDPAAVVLRPFGEYGLGRVHRLSEIDAGVVDRVEHANDLVVDAEGMRNEDVPAQDLRQSLRDERLAVAGIT